MKSVDHTNATDNATSWIKSNKMFERSRREMMGHICRNKQMLRAGPSRGFSAGTLRVVSVAVE